MTFANFLSLRPVPPFIYKGLMRHLLITAAITLGACGTADPEPGTTTPTTSAGCECPEVAHAHSVCFHLGAGGGEPTSCALTCDKGWADCDGDKANGCESSEGCAGTAGAPCDPAVATSCVAGSVCNAAGVCSGGNGCTTPGAEGMACGSDGTMVCAGGICVDGGAP